MGMEAQGQIKNIGAIDESSAMIRLTALWALSEAGLGGLLHFLRTPFTGLLVGSVAVVLICMMAYVSEKPYKSIPKALVLVLIVKMTISPHSPIPAYMAVSFQGIMGALLFSVIPSFRVSCVLLGFLGLLESAIQKLLTLTIIFGKSIWESIDLFVDFVLQKMAWLDLGETADGSFWLVIYYVSLYSVFGLIIGYCASKLPALINQKLPDLEIPSLGLEPDVMVDGVSKRPWWKSNKIRYLLVVLMLIVLAFLLIPEARQVLNPLWIFARVILVLMVWYLLVAPLLVRLFQKYLDKKASEYRTEVKAALSLIPIFRKLVYAVWDQVSFLNGFARLKEFVIRIIAYALIYK